MKLRAIPIAASVALLFIVLVVIAYVGTFGPTPISDQSKWGEFGDYFGGLLNPLFSMLAFLALLWSITVQAAEFERTADRLSEQAQLARAEIENNRQDRLSQELLHVIKDIDARLSVLLQVNISPPGASPQLTIAHMVAEAERVATSDADSPAYSAFLEVARTPGTVLEASIRDLLYLVEKMREFIEQYSITRKGAYAPVIVYHADKVFHTLHLIHDLGGAREDTFQFFATVADPHG